MNESNGEPLSEDLKRSLARSLDPDGPAFAIIEKALLSVPPHLRADTVLMARAIIDFPDCGAHFVYGVYRDNGGTASWKTFRRTVEVLRRGDLQPSKEGIELDRARRRQQEMKERAEARVRKEQERAREREERERQKEESMTIRREDLYETQRVWVRVRYAGLLKLTPARVLEVVRAAVRVQIDGEKSPRLVRFNEISLTGHEEEASPSSGGLTAVPPAFQGLGEGRGVQQVQQQGRHHPYVERRHSAPQPTVEMRRPASMPVEAPSPPVTAPPPASPPSPPASALDQVAAWIEQGSGMRQSLVKQKEALQEEMDALAAEALRIEEATKAKRAEFARVDTLLTALDQMRTVAA